MSGKEIIELARALGKAMSESETYKNYTEAKKAFRADTELKKKLTEFKVQKALLDRQAELENADEAVLDAVGARAELLYREIEENPVFARFQVCETEYNNLVGAVNATIDSYLAEIEETHTGSGCTGNCASCHGCDSKKAQDAE